MSSNQAQRLLMEALGTQSGFWGLGRTAGELYAALYTASKPQTLGALAEQLGVTKGNVSIAIRRLEELHMVRRRYEPGDRRVYFTPNIEFWDIARQFLQRRYQPAFAASFQLVDQSLEQSKSEGDAFLEGRIEALKTFYDLLDHLTDLLLTAGPAELARIAQSLAQDHDGPNAQ